VRRDTRKFCFMDFVITKALRRKLTHLKLFGRQPKCPTGADCDGADDAGDDNDDDDGQTAGGIVVVPQDGGTTGALCNMATGSCTDQSTAPSQSPSSVPSSAPSSSTTPSESPTTAAPTTANPTIEQSKVPVDESIIPVAGEVPEEVPEEMWP
jgi:hypothetical protein